MVKNPGNGRLNNLNDPVLNVLMFNLAPYRLYLELWFCSVNQSDAYGVWYPLLVNRASETFPRFI